MKKECYSVFAALLLSVTFAMAQLPVRTIEGAQGIKSAKVKLSELRMQQANALEKVGIEKLKELPLKSRLKEFKKLNELLDKRRGHNLRASAEGGIPEDEMLREQVTTGGGTETIWSNFLASTFQEANGYVPPDPNGDVGPTQVVVMQNAGIKVFEKRNVTDPPLVTSHATSDKEPPAQLFITLDKFFSPVLPIESRTSDPHVRYDRLSKRWFVVAVEVNFNLQNNAVLLAVSDGDRITDSSSFAYYSFPSTIFEFDPGVPILPFLDFPTLGVDKNSILIGGDAFFADSINTVGYVIDKSNLLRGKLGGVAIKLGTYDFNTGNGIGIYAPQGVQNDDPEAPKSFFAGISLRQFNLEPLNFGEIVLASIGYNSKNVPKTFKEVSLKVDKFNFPRVVTALGNQIFVDPNDTKLLAAAIYKNKLTGKTSLWTAHCIAVNQAGDYVPDSVFENEARDASRFYEIGDIYKSPEIEQQGTLFDRNHPNGRKAVNYFNPSIASNGQGHALLGGTTASFKEYLNVFIAGHDEENGPGSIHHPQKATKTTAIYDLFSPRWGDFSQTVVDPLDDQTLWTFQEYTATDGNFGVRAVQVKAPPPATPVPIGTLSATNDTTITIKGISVNNSGFFDPGSDNGGPGFNRLSLKTNSDIIVRLIKFVSPTEIRVRLGIKNKQPGDYILIITNPDGQAVTATFTISGSVSPITVVNGKAPSDLLRSSAVYPNPTTNQTTVMVDAAKALSGRLMLLDVNGKKVQEKNYMLSAGRNEIGLSLAGLGNGSYIAVLYDANNTIIATHVILKQ